ncbi:drug/metabolite transporter superfamily [Armillaria novae-zelandiae]|uniref:Drug/metabolite transporter superfamily n=1 Tax=Armillaria novae-zelandiae TaxID=153914 RepID=A0AA39NRS6_9AGAR|nr:drug/metabolite transporter superfamily [Armillaria novae-zelandiae]
MAVGAQDETIPLLYTAKKSVDGWRCSLHQAYKRNVGLLLIAASMLAFSMSNASVKELSRLENPVSTLELVGAHMVWTFDLLRFRVPEPFRGPEGARGLLVIRGLCGFVGVSGVYYALKHLSLSEATVLSFLAPFATAISGSIFLGETLSVGHILAGLLNIFGVVCIAQPVYLFGQLPTQGAEDPEFRLLAVGMSLIGVMGSTGAYTTIRAIGFRAHPLHSLASYSLQCVIATSIGMVVTGSPIVIPTQPKWGVLFAILVLTGFVGQVLLSMGLQRETAGRGTTAIYTQIVFATIIERIFFEYIPNAWSAIGIVVIMSVAIYVAMSKPQESPKDELIIHNTQRAPMPGSR